MSMTPKQIHRHWLRLMASFIVSKCKGNFVECGVKQGTSAVILAQTLGTRGYLFDTWTGFPHFSKPDVPNPSRLKRLSKRLGGSRTKRYCIQSLRKNKVYRQCKMIQGDICITVPEFVKEHKDLDLSFVHVDPDLYQPAKISFDCFWPYIKNEGIIFVHDYGSPNWPGIQTAVDEFLSKHEDAHLFVFKDTDFCACIIVKGSQENLDALNKFYTENR